MYKTTMRRDTFWEDILKIYYIANYFWIILHIFHSSGHSLRGRRPAAKLAAAASLQICLIFRSSGLMVGLLLAIKLALMKLSMAHLIYLFQIRSDQLFIDFQKCVNNYICKLINLRGLMLSVPKYLSYSKSVSTVNVTNIYNILK